MVRFASNFQKTQIKLETRLSNTEINEGEPLEMKTLITVGDTKSNRDACKPITTIGIPAGLDKQSHICPPLDLYTEEKILANNICKVSYC